MTTDNTVWIWLHRPVEPARKRQAQSALARRLLSKACKSLGVKLPVNFHHMPALELFDTLAEGTGVHASISHCSQLIAVALADGRVGVDCESSKPGRDWQSIADVFFTREEAESLRMLPTDQDEGRFLHYWTMKEAFVKATRGDFWTDRNTLSFQESEIITITKSGTGKWNFWHGDMAGTAISACSEGSGDQPYLFAWCHGL